MNDDRRLVQEANDYLRYHGVTTVNGFGLGSNRLVEAQLLIIDLSDALARRIRAEGR